jgi:tRNA(Arg) A34 adenosine deaminase TadA
MQNPLSDSRRQAAPAGSDIHWMQMALQAARRAAQQGEVPVGAVVVCPDGQLLACQANAPIALHDPSAHAEILALRAAGHALNNYRLTDCTLYVTLEPCPMCMGAIATARLGRLVYGASDERLGACGSAFDLAADRRLNAHTQIEGGLLASESAGLLKAFFQGRRTPPKERLLRIRRLLDLPNVDPQTAAWLEARGIASPVDLQSYADEAGLAWLCEQAADHAESKPELLARLSALHRFICGGDAAAWRTFLKTTPSP